MRYVRLCVISLLATLPLAVYAGPQPLEQIKQSESQLSGRVGMVEMDLRQRPHAGGLARR